MRTLPGQHETHAYAPKSSYRRVGAHPSTTRLSQIIVEAQVVNGNERTETARIGDAK